MRSIFYILLLMSSIGCKQNCPVTVGAKDSLLTSTYIPFAELRNPGKVRGVITQSFGLDSLAGSQDWLEIRLFRYYRDIDPIQLVVLKRRGGHWTGFRSSLYIEQEIEEKRVKYTPTVRNEVAPKIGWDSLCNRVLGLGILNIGIELPLHDNSSTDGNWVVIEYASRDGYRKYEAQDPELFEETGSRKIAEICLLLERELPFAGFFSGFNETKGK
jgi:hypothetical protein